MASNIFLTLCFMGENFMVYALIHFLREGRRAKMTRPGKVIHLTDFEGKVGKAQEPRRPAWAKVGSRLTLLRSSYGLGGVVAPFIGIKLLDMLLTPMGMA
jgi:hypothetical protein